MTDWIKDLGEQNTMLVHTVEDLEQTACSRVKLLEEKLKQSQMIADIAGPNYSEEVRGLFNLLQCYLIITFDNFVINNMQMYFICRKIYSLYRVIL